LGNEKRKNILHRIYGDKKTDLGEKSLFLRIEALQKIAEGRKDQGTLKELAILKLEFSPGKKIDIHHIDVKLKELESRYSYNSQNIASAIDNLEKRAKKVSYPDVLDWLDRLRKHVSGTEIIKNKPDDFVATKLKSLEQEIVLVEELLAKQTSMGIFPGNQK